MNRYIAYCGLNCEVCEAHRATINNDNALREQIAAHWSELNGVLITPEMINCDGCRMDGVKTPFCDSLCPIRQCALQKRLESCGSCSDVQVCEKADMILGNNEDARRNLGMDS